MRCQLHGRDLGRGMDADRRARLAALGAVAWLVLTAAAFLVWASPLVPEQSGTPQEIARWYAEHRTTCIVAGILATLALPPFMVFVAGLFGRLREAEGARGIWALATLQAGVLIVAVHFLWVALMFGAAYRAGEVAPSVTSTFADMTLLLSPASASAYGALMLFAGLGVRAYGGLPRWVGTAGLVGAAAQLLWIPVPFATAGVFDPSDGLLGLYVPFSFVLVWVVAAGWGLVADQRVRAGVPAMTAGA